MAMAKICEQCGNEMVFRQGVGKSTGKPYKQWKCSGCDNIVWINEPKTQAKSTFTKPPFQPKSPIDNRDRMMMMSYAKDCAISDAPIEEIIERFDVAMAHFQAVSIAKDVNIMSKGIEKKIEKSLQPKDEELPPEDDFPPKEEDDE